MARTYRKLDGTCSIEGCEKRRAYVSSGWCQMHYMRWRRHQNVGGSAEVDQTATGASSPFWQGANVGYYSAHNRVKALWGKATNYLCVDCGLPASQWAYDGTDPDERFQEVHGYEISYSPWPEFYMPMCISCHKFRDGRARSNKRTHCREGHELSAENTREVIYSKTKDGRRTVRSRQCQTCQRAKTSSEKDNA